MKGLWIASSVCVFLSGCTGYVDKSRFDDLSSELLSTKQQLSEAQKQIADLQSHRYQVFNRGPHTWRLDTISGDTCLLLAPQADWSKELGQNCADVDLEHKASRLSQEGDVFDRLAAQNAMK